MFKLKLEIDALRVESFQTAAASTARGTVRGNAAAVRCNSNAPDCDGLTCAGSCIGPCTSDGVAVAGGAAVLQPSDEVAVTDKSYWETCYINTCAGCTSDAQPC